MAGRNVAREKEYQWERETGRTSNGKKERQKQSGRGSKRQTHRRDQDREKTEKRERYGQDTKFGSNQTS